MLIKVLDYKEREVDKLEIGDKSVIMTQWEVYPPEPKYNYVDVPFRDGALDLTDTLTGQVHYGMKEGFFKFIIKKSINESRRFEEDIVKRVHGKKCIVENEGKIFKGRITVEIETDVSNYRGLILKGRFE